MELKPVELEVVYDLKAMEFEPSSMTLASIQGALFMWAETPEGYDYWSAQRYYNLTQEGRDKIRAMREQFDRENTPTTTQEDE